MDDDIRSILFVDDDEKVINALERSMVETEYNCFYATGGREALKLMEDTEIDLVIADMVMPIMDGYHLLKKVEDKYPDTARLVLSAYSESEKVKRCLVEGLIENYLSKPWKDEELKTSIENALSLKADLEDESIVALLSGIKKFPVLPSIYYDVSQASKAGKNAVYISKIISKDAAFAADVMKVSNSAFYYHGKRTTSVMSAIVFLGMRTLKTIMINISLFKSLDKEFTDEAEQLWDHCALTNELAFTLYKSLTFRELPDEFHSAGLLHDLGKFFLMNALPDKYKEIMRLIKQNPDKNWIDVEKEVVEVSHAKLGSLLLKKWNFTRKLPIAVEYHHRPMEAPFNVTDKQVMAVLYMANALSWKIMNNEDEFEFPEEIYQAVKKGKPEVERAFNLFREERKRRLKMKGK